VSRRARNLKARRAFTTTIKRPKSKLCEATGKLGYKTREDAVASVAEFSRREHYRPQRIYPCPFCHRFHTTSEVKP